LINTYLFNTKKRFFLLQNRPVAFARAFNLATYINLLTHYAKGTSLAFIGPLNAYKITNYQLSFTVLSTIT